MEKWIKNTSGSSKYYNGQLIANGAYYMIELIEHDQWAFSSEVHTDVASGDLVVALDDSGTTDITDTTEAACFLKAPIIYSDRIYLTLKATITSSTAVGKIGQISWDDDYFYVCVATNTWKRIAIGTW